MSATDNKRQSGTHFECAAKSACTLDSKSHRHFLPLHKGSYLLAQEFPLGQSLPTKLSIAYQKNITGCLPAKLMRKGLDPNLSVLNMPHLSFPI